jgi:hypothetical protein
MRWYSLGIYGTRNIADKLNREGYRFRDAQGKSAFFDRDSVRAITANWPEYGGVVLGKKAIARKAKALTPETVTLNPERAVMDIELCYQVAKIRLQRTYEKQQRQSNKGDRADVYIFPLSQIAYCSHCDKIAKETNDLSRRSHLIGHEGARVPRYRHSERRHKCTAENHSVKAEILEREFARLISTLTVKPETAPSMAEALAKINQQNLTEDRKAEILSEIALCKQRIQNAEKLFVMARIDEAKLNQHIEESEHEIARLQTQMSDEAHTKQMIQMAANMLADMANRWEDSSLEDKQGFARTLFSEIVFDLDTYQITGFTLKGWAEQFLQILALQNGADIYQNPSRHA